MKIKKGFDNNLEALRGFLAFFVASSHLIGTHNRLHPKTNSIFTFQPPGHLSVLTFFIISGYVIELTYNQGIDIASIPTYLRKRATRIYPIYLASIGLALFATNEQYSWIEIIHNLTFTQIINSDIIKENAPSWSLCYEVLYYLLFIPVCLTKGNPFLIIITSLLVGLVNFNFYPLLGPAIISSSAFGFIFWITGLALARYLIKKQEVSSSNLISSLFLFLSLPYLDVLTPFFNNKFRILFHYDVTFPTTVDWFNAAISFYDLAFVPYGLLLILNFTGKRFPLKKHITFILYIIPSYAIYTHLRIRGLNSQINSSLVIPITFYIISILMLLFKSKFIEHTSSYLLRVGTKLGSISYGIYIIHYPIVYILRQTTFYNVSGISFLPRFLAFITAVIFLGYLLEKKLQPWVKRMVAF